MHSQIIIYDFLYCKPVVLNQEGDMKGSLRGYCWWFFYGNA